MPDWTQHVRPQVTALSLPPTRESEIVDELAQPGAAAAVDGPTQARSSRRGFPAFEHLFEVARLTADEVARRLEAPKIRTNDSPAKSGTRALPQV